MINLFAIRTGTSLPPASWGDACSGKTPNFHGSLVATFCLEMFGACFEAVQKSMLASSRKCSESVES